MILGYYTGGEGGGGEGGLAEIYSTIKYPFTFSSKNPMETWATYFNSGHEKHACAVGFQFWRLEYSNFSEFQCTQVRDHTLKHKYKYSAIFIKKTITVIFLCADELHVLLLCKHYMSEIKLYGCQNQQIGLVESMVLPNK